MILKIQYDVCIRIEVVSNVQSKKNINTKYNYMNAHRYKFNMNNGTTCRAVVVLAPQ